MHSLKLAAAAAITIAPTIATAHDTNARIDQKQKAWMVSNFETFDCAVSTGPTSALTGTGTVSFANSVDSGVDLTVTSGDDGIASVTAHAINTKGTGATNGRSENQSCPTTSASRGSNVPVCSISGDAQSPAVRFNVPFAALGDPAAKNYVGTVTIVKRASAEPMVGMYLSKKGYDYYQVRSDMAAAGAKASRDLLVIASCDSTGLTAKDGKPKIASYDLAVGKK